MNYEDATMGKLPELHSYNDNLSVRWYVCFSCRNPKTTKLERIRVSGSMNRYLSKKERYAEARKLIKHYTKLLKSGWNYFVDKEEKSISFEDISKEMQEKYTTLVSSNATFKKVSEQWLNIKINDGSLSKVSAKSYTGPITALSEWLESQNLLEVDITVLNHSVIMKFFNHAINEKNYAKETLKRLTRVCRNVFDYAVEQEYIKENPIYDVPSSRNFSQHASIPITDEDRERFRKVISLEDPQLWLAIQLMYYCFLRPRMELRLLQVKHINFARGFILVDADRAKTNKERKVDIPESLMKELVKQNIHKLPAEYYVISRDKCPGTTPVGDNYLYNHFVRFRDRLKMNPRYTLYSWKHTGNSAAVDAGLSLEELKSQNGHTSVQTTEIYIKDKIGKPNHNLRSNFPEI
ncbi:MAG: tyrosine-type recombinase/integrase [Mangrovibacterium sp.]